MTSYIIEHTLLKQLLKQSYNEGQSPFTQIIGKYTNMIISDKLFYIFIIIFILLLILFFIINKKQPKQHEQMVTTSIKKKKQKKVRYNTINEYYSDTTR